MQNLKTWTKTPISRIPAKISKATYKSSQFTNLPTTSASNAKKPTLAVKKIASELSKNNKTLNQKSWSAVSAPQVQFRAVWSAVRNTELSTLTSNANFAVV